MMTFFTAHLVVADLGLPGEFYPEREKRRVYWEATPQKQQRNGDQRGLMKFDEESYHWETRLHRTGVGRSCARRLVRLHRRARRKPGESP